MIINLSYPISVNMFKYPSDPRPQVESDEAGVDEKGKILSAYAIYDRMKNHLGTHIDFPAHKIKNGKKRGDYDDVKFVNDALFVDLTDRHITARKNPGITLDDLNGKMDFRRINDNDIGALLFYTGYCDLMERYRGKLFDEEKSHFESIFPYFTPPAAERVVTNAPYLHIVGIDSFSVDPSGSNSESHKAFLGKETLLLETLYNLRALKQNTAFAHGVFQLRCIPNPLEHADASWTVPTAEIPNGVK